MLYLKKAVAIEEEYALMNVMKIGVYILRLTNVSEPTVPNTLPFTLCNISSSMQQLVQQKFNQYLLLLLVGKERLELSPPKGHVPKTCVSAIPPLAQISFGVIALNIFYINPLLL